MSVVSAGCNGPFEDDEEGAADTAYDRLAIDAEALRVENRLLLRELQEMRDVVRSVTETLNDLIEERT